MLIKIIIEREEKSYTETEFTQTLVNVFYKYFPNGE